MFTSYKIKYVLSTKLGLVTLPNKDVRGVGILDIMDKYSHNFSYWLYVYRFRKFKSNDKAGKWMLFIKDGDLPYCMDILVRGVDKGIFDVIKCSVPNQFNPHYTPGVSAIMVYTNDYENKVEIKKVLDYLLSYGLDFDEELFYKADYQTREGKYEGGRGESWLYSSKDFR